MLDLIRAARAAGWTGWLLLILLLLPACGGGGAAAEETTLVIYSGRSEELVGPLITQFETESGIEVSVRYGGTTEMAAAILEEGGNSPADVFFAQDAGALGALAGAGRLRPLPEDLLGLVNPPYRDATGRWVGVTGRSRVVVYNSEVLTENDLPDSILDYTDPKWMGRIGWAPTNGSFQAFVTALRVTHGEEAARDWLEGIQANAPKNFSGNTPILEAVASGEVDVGFVNHYYLFRKLDEQGKSFPARNYFFTNGDIGGLVNVAGAGILDSAAHPAAAETFIRFLLSEAGQSYFRDQTHEYPLNREVAPDASLPALDSLGTPEMDLNRLEDLEGTLQLLEQTGVQ